MKKIFISPKLNVVKVKSANIICASCQGQMCGGETCSGESFAKEGFSNDLGRDLDNE